MTNSVYLHCTVNDMISTNYIGDTQLFLSKTVVIGNLHLRPPHRTHHLKVVSDSSLRFPWKSAHKKWEKKPKEIFWNSTALIFLAFLQKISKVNPSVWHGTKTEVFFGSLLFLQWEFHFTSSRKWQKVYPFFVCGRQRREVEEAYFWRWHKQIPLSTWLILIV